MTLDNSRIEELVRNYINQRCTPDEIKQVGKLMSLPHLQLVFDEVLGETWTELEPAQDIDLPHLEQQLHEFYKRLNE